MVQVEKSMSWQACPQFGNMKRTDKQEASKGQASVRSEEQNKVKGLACFHERVLWKCFCVVTSPTGQVGVTVCFDVPVNWNTHSA